MKSSVLRDGATLSAGAVVGIWDDKGPLNYVEVVLAIYESRVWTGMTICVHAAG